MGRRRGRHRRPSARPAVIVTIGAGALLIGAAVPAGSVVGSPVAPVPGTTTGTAPGTAPGLGVAPSADGRPASAAADPDDLINGLLEQLTQNPSALVGSLKEKLAALEAEADAKSLADEAAARVKQAAEGKAGALEALLDSTERQIHDNAADTAAALKQGLEDLRDSLGSVLPPVRPADLYAGLVQVLRDVAGR